MRLYEFIIYLMSYLMSLFIEQDITEKKLI